jgi:hypothetical protein
MKKILSFCMAFMLAALFLSGPMITKYAFADDKYESVTVTATTIASTWTLLQGSTLKHNSISIQARGKVNDIQVFGGGNTYNAAADFTTIKNGTPPDYDEIYKSTTGTYARTTATGVSEVAELKTKRPASYWPWR